MKNIVHQPYVEYGQKNYIEETEKNVLRYKVECVSVLKFVPDGMEEILWLCDGDDIKLVRPDKINGEEIDAVGAMIYGVRADYGFHMEGNATVSNNYTICGRNMHPLALEIINSIIRSYGRISVSELAKQYNYTERHINNIMQEAVMCSPKCFTKIVRFQNALGEMLIRPDRNNSEFIEKLSYSDQAHFQREFKTLAGETPKQFITKYKRFLHKNNPENLV